MIDLRKHYLSTVKADDYHYRFYDAINNVNMTYNVFEGPRETADNEFLVYDDNEAIDKFRSICRPENEANDKVSRCWFYLLTYYLDSMGYYIKEFQSVLSRPPEEPHDFIYTAIRDRALKLGLDNTDGIVTYDVRRRIVADMNFIQRGTAIELGESLERTLKAISTHDASFCDCDVDEQLAQLCNLIEYLLKGRGGFRKLDYSTIALGYLDDETIMKYRKQIQCFRHAAADSLEERNGFNAAQKDFLVELGILICKTIDAKLRES